MIIITKVINNRVVKFIECDTAEDASEHLLAVVDEYPSAFIYDGEYTPDLYINAQEVTQVALPLFDWRPQGLADLNILRAKLIGVLSAMQVDYYMAGQMDSAQACLNAKNGLRVIETSTPVQTAYLDPNGTRQAFDLAVKTQWGALVAPAPAQVKTDFVKYGGNTT